MVQPVRVLQSNGVATLTIDYPPVNALAAPVRIGLMDGLADAVANPDIKVILIVAAGRTWPAGADIREFGRPHQYPSLPELCQAIVDSPKPVVAAMHGTVLGGGLELALSAGYRLAKPGTKLGLPEVSLGLLPGAGGTQRLPRLIGAKPALGLMLSGLPMEANRALSLGLIDQLAPRIHRTAAEFAAALVVGDAALPVRTNLAETAAGSSAWLTAVAEAREGMGSSRRLPAPSRIIDCVEAALLLPEAEGFAFERVCFEELMATPESAALRHAFLSERRAARLPGMDGVVPREINHVGVIGGGLMGSGIATSLLSAGYKVTLVEREAAALAAGLSRVASNHERSVEAGRLSAAAREEEWDRIAGSTDMKALAATDLVIEAAYEDEAVKAEIFAELDAIMPEGAILATNTSYLDVNRIAAMTERPADVIGLHFFSPAQVMRLVEVVVADQTAPDVVATGFALAKRLGKVAVRSGVCDGFIGNRILTAYRTATDFLMEDGASPYEIDRAMVAFGFPLGPYQVQDLAGLDISWARRKRLAASRDPAARYVEIADKMCEAGRLGQKAGRGYYRYPDGTRKGVEDPEVLALIEDARQAKGIVPRAVDPQEICQRALAAMANEGARIIEDGIALRPSDVDLVLLMGYGFPRWRGGPLLAADQVGMLEMRDILRDYAREDPQFWHPAPLWDDLIKNGRKFADLNEA
ncbi:MAG: FAD-dependent oxidoreductase [Albidovulum sp.]